MVKLGYNCNDFMNQIESSQEILLAAGWLISTQNVLEIFISQLNRPIDDEYFKEKHFQVKTIIVYWIIFEFTQIFHLHIVSHMPMIIALLMKIVFKYF